MKAEAALVEMAVAAFEPGASRKGLTKYLIDLCKREESPDLLLRTTTLALYELDTDEADNVLDFAFSVVEDKRDEVLKFINQQLTYALLAKNYVFSDHLLERSSALGVTPLQVYFGYWTDHTDESIRWLKENAGRAQVLLQNRFFQQYWKHLSSQGMIDLLRLTGRAELEARLLSMCKAEQDYCGWLAGLIELGKIPDDIISTSFQSLILARDVSNAILDQKMTIGLKVFIERMSLDALTELFVGAVCVANDHDDRRLLYGFQAIIGVKVSDLEALERAWNRVSTAQTLRSAVLVDLGDGLEVFVSRAPT